MSITRRDFLIGSAALAAGASVSTLFSLPKHHSDRRSKRSRVAVLRAEQYSQQIDRILAEGLRLISPSTCELPCVRFTTVKNRPIEPLRAA